MFFEKGIKLPQRMNIIADISHCESLNCGSEIKLLSPAQGTGYHGSDIINLINRLHE